IVKLADFGIAKLLDESLRAAGTHTNTSQVMGTAAYMAPEQAIAGMAVDHRIDVYAFGVVLYECVTGQRPYHGADGSVFEVMQSLAQRRPSSSRTSSGPTSRARWRRSSWAVLSTTPSVGSRPSTKLPAVRRRRFAPARR